MIERVEAALEKIRPFLKADGGDVKVLEITDEMIVRLELLGACESCPMSHMTMKAGIEEAIKRDIPEIKGVVAVSTTTV
ncbi:NifU family protein [Roseivirga sp.]|uniref:NifU family protein n=1 Tax=Roseivirga sp. TaxID=1964215 RepID=UPI002B26FF6E|nr:NifU family protein [Roseivirga sp.]